MQRYDYFFRQKVTEGELDSGFDAAEQMEFNLHLAQGVVGVQSQGIVTENSGTPNLTVDISGPAEIRDQLGQRVAWTPTQDLDCSVDENTNPTAVTTPGNERYLSIFAKFVRVLSDPRLDGVGDVVQHNRAEGFQVNVVQGAEAALGTAARPGLRADEVLLADVLLINGQTQILNADILTNRREDAFVVTLGSGDVHAGQQEEALQSVASQIEADAGGGGPYVTVADLADLTTPDDGATLVGVDAIGGATDLVDISQGTLQAVLAQVQAELQVARTERSLIRLSNFVRPTNVASANHVPVQFARVPAGELSGAVNLLIGVQTGVDVDLMQGTWHKSDWAGAQVPVGTPLAAYDCRWSQQFQRLYIVGYNGAVVPWANQTTDPIGVAHSTISFAGTKFAAAGRLRWIIDDAANSALVIIGDNSGTNGGAVLTTNGTTFSNPSTEPASMLGAALVRCGDVSPGGTMVVGGRDSGATNEGIWRSTDGGDKWVDVSPAGAAAGILNTIVYDSHHGVWFAGDAFARVFRSADDGLTWTVLDIAATGLNIGAGLVGGDDDGAGTVALMDNSETLVVSTDGGLTWIACHPSQVQVEGGGAGVGSLNPADNTVRYIAEDGVWLIAGSTLAASGGLYVASMLLNSEFVTP